MTEKETMTATFDLTPEARDLLISKESEYIVANPVVIEATFDDGRTMRYPKNIRERVVRCKNCASYRPGHGVNFKPRCEKSIGTFVPEPDGFCAWGSECDGE